MCGNGPGSEETYAEQVCMPINGKVRNIDRCIARIIAALNAGGVPTYACCCGHGTQMGSIILDDGRVLAVIDTHGEDWKQNYELWKQANAAIHPQKDKP